MTEAQICSFLEDAVEGCERVEAVDVENPVLLGASIGTGDPNGSGTCVGIIAPTCLCSPF